MYKTYTATHLYTLKSVMLVFAMIAAFLVFNFGMMMVPIIPVWVVYVVNIVLALFAILFMFLLLTSKKPGFTFYEDGFKYKRKKVSFTAIKSLMKAQGGSEPEIFFTDGTSLVLELSWFLKKDRDEIITILQENIK